MSKRLIARVAKRDNDDWMKCCKYCRSFNNEKCWNKKLLEQSSYIDTKVYEVQEEGKSSEAIGEALNNERLLRKFLSELTDLLYDWNVSAKKRKEFEERFYDEWEEFSADMKEEIDDAVAVVYQDYLDRENAVKDDGLYIDNPSEFCCKEWS